MISATIFVIQSRLIDQMGVLRAGLPPLKLATARDILIDMRREIDVVEAEL